MRRRRWFRYGNIRRRLRRRSGSRRPRLRRFHRRFPREAHKENRGPGADQENGGEPGAYPHPPARGKACAAPARKRPRGRRGLAAFPFLRPAKRFLQEAQKILPYAASSPPRMASGAATHRTQRRTLLAGPPPADNDCEALRTSFRSTLGEFLR